VLQLSYCLQEWCWEREGARNDAGLQQYTPVLLWISSGCTILASKGAFGVVATSMPAHHETGSDRRQVRCYSFLYNQAQRQV
jgi:hypothetical protein